MLARDFKQFKEDILLHSISISKIFYLKEKKEGKSLGTVPIIPRPSRYPRHIDTYSRAQKICSPGNTKYIARAT